MFNAIAPVYDELNDQLSFGMHKVWKRMTVKWAGATLGDRALDVCCGSGDLTFLLAEAVGTSGRVVGLDFAQDMLDDAASRQARWRVRPGRETHIEWVQGDATKMSLESGSFDAVTMGYGLRNVNNIPAALSELHRVLRPGGKVAILDFNNTQDSVLDSLQGFFLENVVVPAARKYGLEAEYAYLRPSIKAFPTGVEQEALALQAGFVSATHYELALASMGVLVATK